MKKLLRGSVASLALTLAMPAVALADPASIGDMAKSTAVTAVNVAYYLVLAGVFGLTLAAAWKWASNKDNPNEVRHGKIGVFVGAPMVVLILTYQTAITLAGKALGFSAITWPSWWPDVFK